VKTKLINKFHAAYEGGTSGKKRSWGEELVKGKEGKQRKKECFCLDYHPRSTEVGLNRKTQGKK